MNDIVERLRADAECTDDIGLSAEAADEIIRQRQRVQELKFRYSVLTDSWNETAKCRDEAEKELAALKARQSEPVGEVVASVVSESALAAIRWTDDNYTPKVGDKLYTSAPTIQFGEPVAWRYTDGEDLLFTDSASYAETKKDAVALYEKAPTIPDGWQLVPVEPTEEMVSAGIVDEIGWGATISIYKDMLAAAPKPEEK